MNRIKKSVLIATVMASVPAAYAESTPLVSGASDKAASGLHQYGQFVGEWECAPEFRDQEGNWQKAPARPTWVWHWILNGTAIQDVWIPDPERAPAGAAMGTNLRVYDAEKNEWDMVWTTETLGGFQRFSAQEVDGNIVMHGDIPAGPRPAHKSRITFHNIQPDHYDWKYEASAPTDGENWQLWSTLSCSRI